MMSSNDRGATRRRTVPSSTLLKQEASSITPLKRQSRKRTRRSVWIVLIITASCCLVVRLYRGSQQERPMIPSVNNSSVEKHKLLALVYPPGLIGGYRNQVIRLLALVVHALREDFSAILLPSLLWSTQLGNSTTWVPIPMDLLMDVDYWNSFHPKLPLLVEYNVNEKYDCWTVETITINLPNNASSLSKQVVQRGFLTPIYNTSKAIALQQLSINQRRTDFLPNVSHCQHPVAYGGGNMAGRLWNDYIRLHGKVPFNAQPLILQALRPKQEWRNVARLCVEQHASPKSPYIALHARVELEMMNHPCGATMEKNLTKILKLTRNLAGSIVGVKGIFVAVGRSGMEHQENQSGYKKFAHFVDENLRTLNRIVGKKEPHGTLLPVFECGGQALEMHYYRSHPESIDYGSLLQGIINFHVATEANAFVGVRGSSYSTDIWTTRYHQGKGDTNYEYTPDGIVRMNNGGLPPAHTNCKPKKK